MLGRTGFVAPGHVVESTTGTLITPAPTQVSSRVRYVAHILTLDRLTILLRLERLKPTVTLMIPVMANLLREPGILVTTADAVPVDMMMFPAMDGARWVLPVRLLPPRPLARRMIRLAVVAKVDLAHPVVRPAVPLEEMEMVVTIALMSVDCSLLIFVLRVHCPTMRYFVRDVAATVPVLLREIVCLATTDVARSVALIRSGFARCVWSVQLGIPLEEVLGPSVGLRTARMAERMTKRPSARVLLLRRNLLPISSVLG